VPSSGVTAVSLTVTATNPNQTSYLTVAPTGEVGKRTVSFANGEAASNAVIVKLKSDGKIVIGSNDANVRVLVEVNGWYEGATKTWTYAYNGDGLRTSKTAPDGTLTTFAWDQSGDLPLLIAETTSGNTTRYIYGPAGLPVATVLSDGTVRYHHADQLGSTRMLTNSAGSSIGTATFEAYGKPSGVSGITTPLGYAGQYTDAETGFQYLRARYYDPATATFLNRDPIERITRSAFGYAGGNPLNYVDPTGLAGFQIGPVKVGDGCPLGKNPNGSCRGSGAVDDAWDATGGRAVSYVNDHKVGILKGGAVVLAVAAVPASGGTSLALGAGALGLSTGAELLDNRPCKSERVTQTLALGGMGLGVGVLWAGAGQAAKAAGDLASADVAGRIGSAFGVGDVLTNFLPSPKCGC
jgi:RHS repeat-associated protein